MSKNCLIFPQVKNKKGETADSKLFQDLLFALANNREQTIRIYGITMGEQFMQNFAHKLEFDEYGEPTIESLIAATNLQQYIPMKELEEKLNRQIGYYKKGEDRPALWAHNQSNYDKLTKKANEFNLKNPYKKIFYAKVIQLADNEDKHRIYYGVKIYPRTTYNSLDAEKMQYNAALNEELRKILASHGISIGALTELEEKLGIDGLLDLDVAKKTADGLMEMIRLAKGIKGEKALPEEFAHFAIEALGNNPLINRLINYISSNNLMQEIIGESYDSYVTMYNGDKNTLAKEAAGKLLAKHLLQQESIPAKPYSNLLQRAIQAIKNFFKNISMSEIQRAIEKVNKEFANVAHEILKGSLQEEMDVKNITSNEKLYSLESRIKRDKDLLQKIIDNELKRLKVYSKRNPDSPFSQNQQLYITELELSLEDNQELLGINNFLEHTLQELEKVKNRLNTVKGDAASGLNERAKVLRDVRNYLYSYSHILEDIRATLLEENEHADNRYTEKTKVSLDLTTNLLEDLKIEYSRTSMPLFIDFLKPYLGESITIPFGKWKGQTITVEDIIAGVKKDEEGNILWYQGDISFFDRWLDSMADSSDFILKILDQAVKKSKESARLKTIELSKEIKAAAIKLEQAGVRDTKWMFEQDEQGNLTGDYISEIDYGKYKRERNAFYKRLAEKYGKHPVGQNAALYRQEKDKWYKDNLEYVNGKRVPKKSIYANQTFAKLNTAQKEYYNTIMRIKEQLDSFLPTNYTHLTNAVKIRKDLLERVKASEGVISGSKQIWEAVKDQFIRNSDDTEFGTSLAIKDFENREVQTLPIYYTKLKKGESPNDLSTDVTSTLIAYAAMAYDFQEMNKIVDSLELSRDMLQNREFIQERGDKPLKEIFKVADRKVSSLLTKKGSNSAFMQKLDDFFSMQVYGRYMKDEGTFGKSKIDKGKTANAINSITSINNLALNALSGIANVTVGSIMIKIEAYSGQFYNRTNLLHSDKIYAQSLPQYLAEIGKRVKTSKLALFEEEFNIMQEYEKDIKNTQFDRKNWFSKAFQTKALFFMNNAGEHWIQHRTALALADAYKMKDPTGKTVNLWDALEVVYIDNTDHSLGAKLKIKDGYTKPDGTAFTKEDVRVFSRKSAAVNERLHGIYNEADKNAVQRLALGRMAIMYRKWIVPSLNRRFESARYNFDLQEWTEGYYVTTWNFLKQIGKELREGQFTIGAHWNQLTTREQANIRRALIEVGVFLTLLSLVSFVEWPDDEDRSWGLKLLEYQTRRLYTEIGALVPSPYMLEEGLKILKSPAAGINTAESLLNTIGIFNPYNWEYFAGEEALLQSGRYKDHSKGYKLILESPLVPMNKTLYRVTHPETLIPFFKQ